MPRVKRGTKRRARRKKILERASGYYLTKSKLYRSAKESVERALKFARTSLRDHRIYAWVSGLVLLLVSYLIAASAIDTWTVVRYTGSRNLPAAATAWHDSVFSKPLSFYLFDLPFWSDLRGYVFAVVILAILIYWLVARGWQLRSLISPM